MAGDHGPPEGKEQPISKRCRVRSRTIRSKMRSVLCRMMHEGFSVLLLREVRVQRKAVSVAG